MKNKNGSQVGIVLSFVIFMTFIFFIYLITKPALTQNKGSGFLDTLGDTIKKNTSADLTSVSVTVNQAVSESCVKFSGFFSSTGIEKKVISKDSSGNLLSEGVQGDDLIVEKSSNSFYKIYESPEFQITGTGALSSCHQLSIGTGYSIGLIKTKKYVFKNKIISLMNVYNDSYNSLKTQFGISSDKEFQFGFTDSNGVTSQTKNISSIQQSNLNIYAKSVPVNYVDDTSNINLGLINLKSWQ